MGSFVATLSPEVIAGIATGAMTAGAGLMGALTAWRKRQDESKRQDVEEDSITITQAQGANLILDATVKALNAQLDRETTRADRERRRAEQAERNLDACQRKLRDSEGGS